MRLNFKKLALLGGHLARPLAKEVGLTPSRLDFLSMLRRGPLCQRELAEKLCVTEPVISRMVRILVKQGLVERFIPIRDRRFRVVQLTAAGTARYDALTAPWLLQEHGRDCGQNAAEGLWLCEWYAELRALGLEGILAITEGHEEPVWPEPPYALLRLYSRSQGPAVAVGLRH